MNFGERVKAITGSAREHLGVAAVSLCVVVATGILATGGFAGCGKRDDSAKKKLAEVFAAKGVSVAAMPVPPNPAKPSPGATLIVYVTGAVKRPGVYTLASGARLYHAIRAAGGFKPNAVTDALNLADRAQDGDQLCIPSRKSAKVAAPARQAITLSAPPIRYGEPKPLLIRKTLLPAPVVLPPAAPIPDQAAPEITVIATPPAPGRVLGAPTATVSETSTTLPDVPSREIASAPTTGIITLPVAARKIERAAAKTSTKFKNPGDGVVHINSATAAELEQLPRCGPAMSAKILAYRAQIGGRFTDTKQLQDVKGVGEKTFEKWTPFLAL